MVVCCKAKHLTERVFFLIRGGQLISTGDTRKPWIVSEGHQVSEVCLRANIRNAGLFVSNVCTILPKILRLHCCKLEIGACALG